MNGSVLLFLLAATPTGPVDFDTEVLPMLAKAGCNAGACHGAAAGRGGFKLSLFGGDPAADYRVIVRDLEGRRVNLVRPERSLLVLKPTWQLDHEGGERFAADSREAEVLLDWIRAGAPREKPRQLSELAVTPRAFTAQQLPAELQLAVTAKFDDGTVRDVTDLALYVPADSASTAVDERGRVQVLRPGRHSIVVRFLTHVQAVQVTAPQPNNSFDLATAPRNNWIDDEIYRALSDLRLPPSPRADDATLLRRVTLDLTGRLPTPDRVRSYLADDNPLKFDVEVDRLIAGPDFAEYWTYKLARWLRIRVGPNDADGAKTYFAWLRRQVETRQPLDRIVAELLTSDGNTHEQGPPNFHRSAGDARAEAEHVAEALLGIRLRCANCHNHPLDRWTQDDYHGLAAIFAKLERGAVVQIRSSGEVIHPATGEPARQRIPGERFLPANGDGRGELARWVISRENPRFATAWVNRLWQSLLGRGLVEPVDDLRDTNPATHPALLDRLAHDFANNGHDLRHTVRLIVSSAAYQRSSQALPASQLDDKFYSHALSRPLAPEVLLDAIRDATGQAVRYYPFPDPPRMLARFKISQDARVTSSMRAIQFHSPQLAYPDLGPLAPCSADNLDCPAEPSAAVSLDDLTAQLHWINGSIINGQLKDSPQLLNLEGQVPVERMIENSYLRTVSRLPSEREFSHWRKQLANGDEERREDFAWALLSCREFVTNH
jgi:Protein of unknown function (DUF1549)/Protein of unknown function (DUF1553)